MKVLLVFQWQTLLCPHLFWAVCSAFCTAYIHPAKSSPISNNHSCSGQRGQMNASCKCCSQGWFGERQNPLPLLFFSTGFSGKDVLPGLVGWQGRCLVQGASAELSHCNFNSYPLPLSAAGPLGVVQNWSGRPIESNTGFSTLSQVKAPWLSLYYYWNILCIFTHTYIHVYGHRIRQEKKILKQILFNDLFLFSWRL